VFWGVAAEISPRAFVGAVQQFSDRVGHGVETEAGNAECDKPQLPSGEYPPEYRRVVRASDKKNSFKRRAHHAILSRMRAPDARRETLVLVAGIIWSLVGLTLVSIAAAWLVSSPHYLLLMVLGGPVAGYVIYRFGFSHLARKNLVRIYAQAPEKDKVCVFAFQNIRSYLLVVVMMCLGYGLRHSGIPRTYLAPVYLAIGLGLLFSSLLYYNRLRVAG
jgi:hypothetical protein